MTKLSHLQILVKILTKIPDLSSQVSNPYQATILYRGQYYDCFQFELQESRDTYPANKKAALLSWQFSLTGQSSQPATCCCYREVDIAELPALAEELIKTLQTYCLAPPRWDDLEDCDCVLADQDGTDRSDDSESPFW